jgi:cyclase
MRLRPAHRTCAVVLLVISGAIIVSAQNMQVNTRADEGMTAQYIKTGLYVISGRGSNSVVRLSANGLILVDGKLPGGYDALMAQVKRISKQPVRALILTDCADSHTGTNAKFVEDGDGTRIVAQENVKQNLAACNLAGDVIAPATVTYGREYQIRLGGVEAQLVYFGNAHSSSDTVVYFPNLKAVAIGDLFAGTPTPDFAAGGSLVGWGPALAQVLKLDFDVAIPSTGPTITRAELAAFKSKIDILVSRANGLVNKGVPKDQLMSELKTDDLGWQLKFTPDQVNHFYAELSGTQQPMQGMHLSAQPQGQP